MRFLLLVHIDETADVGGPPASLLHAVEAYRADTSRGRWLDDGGLAPSSSALRVRTKSGTVSDLDGPFAEAKEVIGGFFVIESATTADAEAWVRSFVDLHAEHWPQLAYTAELRQIVDPTASVPPQ